MSRRFMGAFLPALILVAIGAGVVALYLGDGVTQTVAAAGRKATATPTPTSNATSTPVCKPRGKCAKTPTSTPTDTRTPTNTATHTPTPTDSPTPANTPTDTPRPTDTATDTPTPTDTATDTPMPTNTATDTPTPTSTPTETPTDTQTPTDTPTDTPTSTPTAVEVVDQQQTVASTSYGGISLPGGYTFTPAAANISSFDIWFWCPISANMVIEEWSSGTVIAGPFVVIQSGGSVSHVDVPGAPISLTPGTKYAILVTSLNSGGTSPSPSICLTGAPGDPYPSGAMVSGGFELAPPHFAADAYFVTYSR